MFQSHSSLIPVSFPDSKSGMRPTSVFLYSPLPFPSIMSEWVFHSVQFHQNVRKIGSSLLTQRDSHVTTLVQILVATPPIDKTSRNGGCSRGFPVVGPHTHSRRGLRKASQTRNPAWFMLLCSRALRHFGETDFPFSCIISYAG